MNPEIVLTMCTEKSVDINHIPGGNPQFTSEDARHALGHMSKEAFNYCQYVFLMYGNPALNKLINDTVCHTVKEISTLSDKKEKRGLTFIISLCRIACEEQLNPISRISDKERYSRLGITRGEWRHKWHDVFYEITRYLNELRSESLNHIYKVTNTTT